MTIKLGFVGCGFVAQQCHLPAFSANKDFDIVSVADPCSDLRKIIQAKYSIPNEFTSHLELIKSKSVDACIVTLPRKMAFHVIKDLLESGIHVMTEKPLCLNSTNARILFDLADQKRIVLHIGYMKEHDPGTSFFKKYIINEISRGNIKSIRAYCFMGNSYASSFGDIKGKIFDAYTPKIEELPKWLPERYSYSFEQFINVFSHITHATELVFNSTIEHKSAILNNMGEGFVIGEVNTIPFCLHTNRGKQDAWIEGIEVISDDRVDRIDYPAAFLKNCPANIVSITGTEELNHITHRPKWGWSFINQTDAFKNSLIQKTNNKNALMAVNQIKFAEDIFKQYIINQ